MRWCLLTLLFVGMLASAQPAIRGFEFAAWGPDVYASKNSDASLKNLAATGANWTGIVVTQFQTAATATSIQPWDETPTDADVRHAIATAHKLGLKVMLKPHVDLSADPKHWRGDIGPGFTEAQWSAWFAAYTRMIVHYADLARREKVEMLCIGTELEGTTHREEDWRKVLAAIRAAYAGPLTYAGNWDGEAARIRFWDTLDYIGVDAYYPLTEKCGATVAELKAGWADGIKEMGDLAAKWKKTVVLTEVGFRSRADACSNPWEWQTCPAVDLQEQARGYQATFEALWAQPWLTGILWWDWEADLTVGGSKDGGYTPWGKPAEAIVRQYFTEKK